MKNVVKIMGNTAYIQLNKEGGGKHIVMVDRCEMEKLREDNSRWYAVKERNRHKAYVMNREGTALHLFLYSGEMPEGTTVEFIDGNPFNCRRSNIRFVTPTIVALNRRTRSSSSSGEKGIQWDKKRNKWRARVRIGGKAVFEKYYTDLEIAKEEIEAFRQKLSNELRFDSKGDA